jgi:hypothetical protein
MLCIVNRIVNPADLLAGLLREVFLVADAVNARIGIVVPVEV